MQTDPDPSPSQSSAESAVGLTFVAVVLVSLFVAGSLGVVATRAAPGRDPAQEPDGGTSAGGVRTPAAPVRQRIVDRFRELMLLREIALRERDRRLLESVYAPGAAGLARDRAEIARLRSAGRRLDGLRLPVKVFEAYRPDNGAWVVVARIGRSPARLVTGSGHQVRATRASAAIYRCTLVRHDGSWRILGLVPS
jgi:hypothetical protein